MFNIRSAQQDDRDQIAAIYQAAFPPEERDLVTNVALALLEAEADSNVHNFVAVDDTTLAGHVAFSEVTTKSSGDLLGHILAPLAVLPNRQKMGIGSDLIRAGIKSLAGKDANLIFVYGDPAYYGRFGFQVETAQTFTPPHKLQFPEGWQALVTNDEQPVTTPTRIQCVLPLDRPELW